ncbi:SDR family NAD(P)-dependent oxidoreductase [Hazenella sp. IB182357]|uniref:SDR family NAD(P)-dependent oxidoreductase n=1 Tax=Polycladospora coralii TaxID=2771432 RepID=A0A926NF93_9BACL|nr:SDR family NAD(P)-dependent oxidoreductase [Polycladospora coralii]MBD1372318.1 SDR family NAD(P)-dependent oxidoreductase [Polycladospora coralii]MBS7531492.1 SDR family NAD(P)-dependent oxidoreductase [Polycladospora coralii]
MKYTVITGASSGIGYESARAFAERGKNLILVARRGDKLEELKQTIHADYPDLDIIVKTSDLTLAENVSAFYESLQDYAIETWINNAGFGNFDPISGQNLTKIQSLIRLNIEALTVLSTLYVRDYANVEGTQLINVSSGAGYTIVADAVTYCASKFYVSAFTEGLAHELKSQGAKMQVKVLAPAATETEFAQRARDEDTFTLEGVMPKYHTAEEMASFMLDLYDGDKILGIVDTKTYTFNLVDPIYPYIDPLNLN